MGGNERAQYARNACNAKGINDNAMPLRDDLVQDECGNGMMWM